MRWLGGIIAGYALLAGSGALANEQQAPDAQGFSPEDDLDCVLYVASLLGEGEGILTPDVASAYLGSMTYFVGRYEAQRGTPINVALAERYPEFLKQDSRQIEQTCGLRTRGFSARMERASRAMAEAQAEQRESGGTDESP
jgi:hypothetical protein